MDRLNKFLEQVLWQNYNNSLFKYIYLNNELFISIYNNKNFVLIGISYKSNKLLINKYSWITSLDWKKLLVILQKYKEIFLKLLEELNRDFLKIWEESDFINIFDKKELWFNDIKNKLEFSFIDDYTYRRNYNSDFDFNFENKTILKIYHSDYECSRCDWPKNSFTLFPNFNEINDDLFFSWKDNKKVDHLFTNITEYESISIWWNKKIDEILCDKTLIDSYDIISLNKSCISVIMWDDIKSIFKYHKIENKKIFYTDQNIDSPYISVINYLKNIEIKKKTQKNEILFFWLDKNKNTYELIEFLKNNFWIKVWNTLLPSIDIKDLWSILDYKLSIFFTWKELKTQNIFKLYPIDNIEMVIPYGITKISILIEGILKELWETRDISKLKEIIKIHKIKNKSLYKEAKTLELGFIIQDFHIKYFLSDNFRWIPLISLFKDMWFKINFFIFDNNKLYSSDIEKFRKYSFNTIVSNIKKELDDFIENKNIQLYYSEISNDNRILSKNKEQFSIWDIEYGIEWFYRTFNLLVKKCNKVKYFNSILSNTFKK